METYRPTVEPVDPEMSPLTRCGCGCVSVCELALLLFLLLGGPGVSLQGRAPGRHKNKGGKSHRLCGIMEFIMDSSICGSVYLCVRHTVSVVGSDVLRIAEPCCEFVVVVKVSQLGTVGIFSVSWIRI